MNYSSYQNTNVQLSTGTIIFYIAIAVLMIVANWKIFTKAGRPGWASIVPFYNFYTEFEMVGMNGWLFLLLLVPIANIVITIMYDIKLAKVFGKGAGFAIGLIFLNPIFLLILAFGPAQYQGPQQSTIQQ